MTVLCATASHIPIKNDLPPLCFFNNNKNTLSLMVFFPVRVIFTPQVTHNFPDKNQNRGAKTQVLSVAIASTQKFHKCIFRLNVCAGETKEAPLKETRGTAHLRYTAHTERESECARPKLYFAGAHKGQKCSRKESTFAACVLTKQLAKGCDHVLIMSRVQIYRFALRRVGYQRPSGRRAFNS